MPPLFCISQGALSHAVYLNAVGAGKDVHAVLLGCRRHLEQQLGQQPPGSCVITGGPLASQCIHLILRVESQMPALEFALSI